MIFINFYKNKQQEFIKFKIKGHADLNKDDLKNKLICAGCSAITFGTVNSLDKLDHNNCQILIKDNLIEINISKITEQNQILLKGLYYSLSTLQEDNHDNIKIKIR